MLSTQRSAHPRLRRQYGGRERQQRVCGRGAAVVVSVSQPGQHSGQRAVQQVRPSIGSAHSQCVFQAQQAAMPHLMQAQIGCNSSKRIL